MSLPIDDRKLILGASDSVSSITKATLPRHPGAALDADVEPLLGIVTNTRSCSWTSNQTTLLRLPN
jgi:hypothetical protein